MPMERWAGRAEAFSEMIRSILFLMIHLNISMTNSSEARCRWSSSSDGSSGGKKNARCCSHSQFGEKKERFGIRVSWFSPTTDFVKWPERIKTSCDISCRIFIHFSVSKATPSTSPILPMMIPTFNSVSNRWKPKKTPGCKPRCEAKEVLTRRCWSGRIYLNMIEQDLHFFSQSRIGEMGFA